MRTSEAVTCSYVILTYNRINNGTYAALPSRLATVRRPRSNEKYNSMMEILQVVVAEVISDVCTDLCKLYIEWGTKGEAESYVGMTTVIRALHE